MPRIWITDEAWPTSQAVLDAATAAGAAVVHHGIPVTLADQVPAGTLGAFDLPDPVVPTHLPLDPHGQLVTLLVVVGALNIDDAEHVAGPEVTAADLIAEAEAWSLGA